MKFDTPAGRNPIDNETVVAKPVPRIDGPMKVTGTAPYAYEHHEEMPNAAYGVVVGAGIAKGRIAHIDTAAAERAPGVLLVLTHRNTPKQSGDGRHNAPQLQGAEVKHYHQAVACVVAESFEQARAASHLVEIRYEPDADGRYSLEDEKDKGSEPDMAQDSIVGDFDAAFVRAAHRIDVTYTTPDQSHSMMEPHASVARWDGDQLTVYLSHQMIHWAREGLAGTLQIPQEKLRVVSAFIGGGFGSKLQFYADPVLAAVAAQKLGRPVKIALSRPLIYNHTTHRPATIQRLRLGADASGRLVAVGHDVWCGNQPGGQPETAAEQTKLLYAGENRLVRTRQTVLDLPEGASMRAPGEAVGMLALECAVDELAEKIGMDPIEFRILNDTQVDPSVGAERPFSTRQLVQCLRHGAERFGWDRRRARPAQVRDGRWLVGIGVASAFRNNLVQASGAKVRLTPEGVLEIETQMTDIGTGSYTILGQVGAEMLGLPIDRVRVRLGDSAYPKSSGSGGSWGANSASSGVYAACDKLRGLIAERAGFSAATAVFEEGRVRAGNESRALAEVAAAGAIEAEDTMTFSDLTKRYAQASFGAHFAEVGVDTDTAEIRVRRMLSVVAAGRIINPQTARSQCLGGMTMGIGAALMEEAVVDERYGYFVNHDLAEYQVPVHADIPALEVEFLEELDDKSSPIKAKGVGELGICGVGAAVANAVYNACGVRVRDYPVTLDKVLPYLAA